MSMAWVARTPLYTTFLSKIWYRMPSKKPKDNVLQVDSFQHQNECMVVIWASGTPEQFLLQVCTAMHVCKQLGIETKEVDAMMALEAA